MSNKGKKKDCGIKEGGTSKDPKEKKKKKKKPSERFAAARRMPVNRPLHL